MSGALRRTFDVAVPMRDGVNLAADVYRPDTPEPVPVVVARTPYNKNTQFAYDKAQWYISRGYAFVWMDVRGRGDSEGRFTPYRYEGEDGYDAIEWAAAQPWSTGRVVTWGQSYLGAIQWLTAVQQPPHLAAMIVYVTPSDPFVEWPTGVHLPQELCWQRLVSGKVLQFMDSIDWMPVYEHLPLMTMDERAGFSSEHWREDLAHPPADSAYWAPLAYQHRLDQLNVPALHVTGWYDDVQPGSIRNFEIMSSRAGSARARQGQRLVVGPWDHSLTRQRRRTLGAIDFGAESGFDLDGYEVRWLDHYVKGEPNGADREPRAHLFVMGRNRWRTEDEWPLARTRWTSYYLSSDGAANTLDGDGVLTVEQPAGDERPDAYRYDPLDPVPFITEPTSSQIGGPDDYRDVEARPDVLVYTTPALAEDVEVIGPVRAELYASSDAPDTDFMAKLIDVHPDGFCQRLCDGMVRGRFREGMDREAFMEPGQVYRFEVDLWSTAQVFRAGHRIRLEVSSSAFPKYDRNLNTGEPLATGTDTRVAVNRVWHGASYPSRLILPVIPADTTIDEGDA